MKVIKICASEIEVDDYLETTNGWVRVVGFPARDVFSQCYYYRNVALANGQTHEFVDTNHVRVRRFTTEGA